jgi:dipeptidyl aminopeptidase/acylaminoacyl peptidase
MAGSFDTPTSPAAPAPAHGARRWRRLALLGIAAAVIALAAYGAVGTYAYDQISSVKAGCGGRFAGNSPASFTTTSGHGAGSVDTGPYWFTDYRDVTFASRTDDLQIRAWYAPARTGTTGPAVVVVHGFDSCRRDGNVLLPAGMLHRAGFGVLLLDLRNHGDSGSDNGRWAGGAKEYADVLGAWDWLVAQGYAPGRVGLLGVSLGAGTVSIAIGEEPRVPAAWTDSSYADFGTASSEYTEVRGFPGFVADIGVQVGRIIGDPELGTRSPDQEVLALAGRPFAIVHGDADRTVKVHNAFDLAAAAARGGTDVTPWIVAGADHTDEMIVATGEYEGRLDSFFEAALGTPD